MGDIRIRTLETSAGESEWVVPENVERITAHEESAEKCRLHFVSGASGAYKGSPADMARKLRGDTD